MSTGGFLAACLLALSASVFSVEASAQRRGYFVRAPGPTRLGPWVEEGWRLEDWSRAPAVRDWDYSAPAGYNPFIGYPSSRAEYPWGYTTPFVRIGRKCIANEVNGSPGGDAVRYQRVMPSYYCNL